MTQSGLFNTAGTGKDSGKDFGGENVKGLNILWLWPDILGQHGERGNVMALVRMCGLYGVPAKVERVTRLTDDFGFEGFDIAMLGVGELAAMPAVIGALQKRFAELRAWTESGGLLFATGTTGAALGVHTMRLDGSHVYGLGLLDMECRERETVLGDDLIFELVDTAMVASTAEPGAAFGAAGDAPAGTGSAADATAGAGAASGGIGGRTAGAPPSIVAYDPAIYGIQIHMMDIFPGEGQTPFGRTVYGYGNNGSGSEGAVKNGVVFTNALGPVLAKNPHLTLGLINRTLGLPLVFDPELFAFERESALAIKRFNETKEKPKGKHPYLVRPAEPSQRQFR